MRADAHHRLIAGAHDPGPMSRSAPLTIAAALSCVGGGLAAILAVGGAGADAIGAIACAAGLAALARAGVALAADDGDEPPRM
jgi:hypothetical protein